ncbi:hypothetical protein B9Z51_02315 [Limnohabitans sp. T6-5]|uniref:hypothetical protein n=1 Tax=Limnohabitans sp. T6-5 TaxID=1100724 RepID=UPI000D34F3AF|nr:hypothetical protein [Limnohabitans sp. T6-5]PUE11171.1 hypothetical protein B9Z51_02315 [Limnohabitans sp. T6-5]
MTDDFFRNRLDQMIDLRHPLAVLANRMPWQEIEASLAQCWPRQVKAGKKIEDLDLFGLVSVVASVSIYKAGRPRLPTRQMVALLQLIGVRSRLIGSCVSVGARSRNFGIYPVSKDPGGHCRCGPQTLRRRLGRCLRGRKSRALVAVDLGLIGVRYRLIFSPTSVAL